MSTNKHALIRYRVIDRCLRKPDKQWNWQALSKACVKEIAKVTDSDVKSISERTIKEDIRQMRTNPILGYYAPIEYDPSRKSYQYSDNKFSISESPLNKNDIGQISDMLHILKQYAGLPNMEGVQSAINKLSLIISESDETMKQIVELEKPVEVPGVEWVEWIYKAIKSDHTLNIVYRKFGHEAQSAIISPYLLKEYQNRWYVFAHEHEDGILKTFGLERIQSIRESFAEYKKARGFNPAEYFKPIIGISKEPNAKAEEILLKAYGYQVDYILTKPLHPSQFVVRSTPNYTLFNLKIIPNWEFENEILGLGETVEIVEPVHVRERIKDRLVRAKERYGLG